MNQSAFTCIASLPVLSLVQRLEMFARYLAASRSLYASLPDAFCSSQTLSAGHYDTCWNGTALQPYVRHAERPSLRCLALNARCVRDSVFFISALYTPCPKNVHRLFFCEQWKCRWWKLFWYPVMDVYSEAGEYGNSKIWRQMRSSQKK